MILAQDRFDPQQAAVLAVSIHGDFSHRYAGVS
jgi:hypothetical protein